MGLGSALKKAVGTVVGVGTGGLIDPLGQEDAIASAGAAQERATQESIAFQKDKLEQISGELSAAVDAGLIDLNTAYDLATQQLQPFGGTQALEQARGILADPSQVMQDPIVQMQLQRGERGLGNLLSKTTGGGLSSDAMERAMQFNQQFAGEKVNEALGRLMPFINLESQAQQNLSNLDVGRGTALANLRLGGASSLAGTTQGMVPGISQSLQDIGTIQGRTQIAQSNVMPQMLNTFANIARGAGSLASGFGG